MDGHIEGSSFVVVSGRERSMRSSMKYGERSKLQKGQIGYLGRWDSIFSALMVKDIADKMMEDCDEI